MSVSFRLKAAEGAEGAATAISPGMSSLFHGALMQLMPRDYAEQMHITGLHPYSQHLEFMGGECFWTVSALNSEAERNITGSLDGLTELTLEHKGLTVSLEEVSRLSRSYDELFADSYFGEPQSRYVKLLFTSPTAFKCGGKYVNMPSAPLILGGLVRRYDAFSESTEVGSEGLFEQIERQTEISGFDIRSCRFSLEGVRIPAFRGSVTIKVSGSQTFVSFVNMLGALAEFSGCGIKTALGMGGVSAGRSNFGNGQGAEFPMH